MPEAHELTGDQRDRLVNCREAYSVAPAYDDVLAEVSERIRQQGSAGKMDIGALLFWKRLRADTAWVPRLMTTSESDVRAVTKSAVIAANDSELELEESARRGRAALSSLPGFGTGDALASALLYAAAPERMAVYDRRAHVGLHKLLGQDVGNRSGRYARYMGVVDQLVRAVNRDGSKSWTPRDVDLALFVLGASPR